MLIHQGRVAGVREHEQALALDEYVAYWTGLPYWPGNAPGEPSVRRLLSRVAEVGVLDASPGLCGHYFLAVTHQPTGKSYAFVDGGGMSCGFWADGAVASSFLDLARLLRLRSADLDPHAVVEFLSLGAVFFGRTLFPQIRRIAWDEVVAVSGDDRVDVLRKPADDIGEPPRKDFVAHFAELAADFRHQRCSFDLTGGVDSRLVAALLAHFGLDFEIAISGIEGHPDVVLSRELAAVLGKEHHFTRHTVENPEEDLPLLFQLGDGLQDVVRLHRLYQHNHQRVARGASIALTGDGGNFYKDWLWMQDFPFYNRARPNFTRLFDYRILPVPFPENALTPPYRKAAGELKSRVLAGLREHRDRTNSRTYDRVSYYVKTQAAAAPGVSSLSSIVPYYAPLLEPDVVRTGFHLPRRRRFFNRFQRALITRYYPALAPVRTTESGMSLSDHPLHQLKDLGRFGTNRVLRLVKKAMQRAVGKTYLQTPVPDHPDLLPGIMRSATTRDLIGELRAVGVLADGADVGSIGPGRLGRVLTLGFLAQHLDCIARPSPVSERPILSSRGSY
jgi:hypothetical protein